jgi:hypothetical protein
MIKPSLVFLILSLVSGVSSGGPSQLGVANEARALAKRAVVLLENDKSRAVASLMHYPPTYSADERAKDINSVGDGLELTLKELGTPTQFRDLHGLALSYEVSESGGNVPYLRSLSPAYAADFFYEVTYSKQGHGFLTVRVMQLNSKSPAEILSVRLGLPAANPASKTTMIEITGMQLARIGVPMSQALQQQIEASLRPAQVGPALSQ